MTSNTEKIVRQLEQPYTGTAFQPIYTAGVTITPGLAGNARIGARAESTDGILALDLAMPQVLGGTERGTNPEQLFAAGYAACFHGALSLVGRKMRVDVSRSTVSCAVTLGRDPVDTGYRLAAELQVNMPDSTREIAEQIAAGAHQICPYSKAIAGNVDVKVSIV